MFIVGTIKMKLTASGEVTLDVGDTQHFDVRDHAQRYERELHVAYETPDIVGTVFIDRPDDCVYWEDCRVTTIVELCKKED